METNVSVFPPKMAPSLTAPFFLLSVFLLLLSTSPLPVSAARCHKDDKQALLAVKADLRDPYVIISWGRLSEGCCDWVGVDCDPATGRVVSLDISSANTSATIPVSVARLPFLKSLTFHKNPGLTGPIPPAIATLTRLTFLRLDWNSLSGPVPAFLASLTKLEYLSLRFNLFSGSIPPELGSLPLGFLAIDRNRLTGNVPDSVAGSLTGYLYLSHNNLSGRLSKSFAGNRFEIIDLSRNMLSGDASLLFGASKPLERLDLSRNGFEFDLGKVEFPKEMVALDLSHNRVYGSLPPEITKVEWQLLNVSYNQLCGRIPSGGNMDRISQFEFFHNKCLCGAPLAACK